MPVWHSTRSNERSASSGDGLVHHDDHGSQYLSVRYTERLAEAVTRISRAGQGGLATKDDIASSRTELGAMKWVLGLVAALNVAILVRLLLF